MPLAVLACGATKVSDLSPLQGMKLTDLICHATRVSSLSPLIGMKLHGLICADTQVSDLSPLEGMPLKILDCGNTPVSDLSPLQGMNLTEVYFTPKRITKGLDVIRQMKNIVKMGLSSASGEEQKFPPTEFWKKYDAGEFGKPDSKAGGQDHYPTGTPR